MTFYDSAGSRLTKTQLQALTAAYTPTAQVKFTADVYQRYTGDAGSTGFEKLSRLAFVTGQVVLQSDIDAVFKTAVVDTITPATGPAAGGTAFTIRGRYFSGASGVTIGGVAVTSFVVVNDSTITGVSGAHTAATVDVIVQDDAGNVTKTGAWIYT
jgi:hypothetical protein